MLTLNTRHKLLLIFAGALILGLGVLYADYKIKQSTFDNHINVNVELWSYKNNVNATYSGKNSQEAKALNLPQEIEIIKRDNEYYWASNDNKKLTKTIKHESSPYSAGGKLPFKRMVFETDSPTDLIEVNIGNFEVGGCSAVQRNKGTVSAIEKLENDALVSYSGHKRYYASFYDYLFCDYYKLRP